MPIKLSRVTLFTTVLPVVAAFLVSFGVFYFFLSLKNPNSSGFKNNISQKFNIFANKKASARDVLASQSSNINSRKVSKDYVDGEVIVKYKKSNADLSLSSGKVKAENFEKNLSVKRKRSVEKLNLDVVSIEDGSTVEDKITALKNDPSVEYAEPNYRVQLLTIPNDTNYGLQWGLHNTGQSVNGTAGTADADIDAPEMWSIEEASRGTTIVAVIDTGAAINHPDLAGNVVSPWDAHTSTAYPWDYGGHGSNVSGIVGAVANNSAGISGISINNKVKIMPISFNMSMAEAISAITYAGANGAKVINASWGSFSYSQGLYDAIAAFDGLFVTAAGNGGADGVGDNNDSVPFYPAAYNLANIITVAAMTSSDDLTSFSNYGVTSVDVGAPGADIYSAEGYRAFYEDFESVSVPALGTKFTQSGTGANWGTYTYQNSLGTVLYGDLASTYAANASTYATSSAIDISSTSYSYLNFFISCQLPTSTLPSYTDYMGVEVYNGSTWTELDKIYNDSSSGYNHGDLTYDVTSYKSASFRIRFHWVTDSADNTHDGCKINNVKLIDSSSSNGSYQFMSGTSQASPLVAGLTALVWGAKPTLTAAQVKSIIMTKGDTVAALSGKVVSGKRINAYTAYNSVIPPTLAEVTPVVSSGTDPTPNYTFSSTEAGTITYGGSCSSATTSASSGNNTITFNTLSAGTYSNCTITVTDSDSNASVALSVTSFTIVSDGTPDTTPPDLTEITPVTTPTTDTTPSYVFNSTEAGTITYGGSCSSSTTSALASNNTITFNTLSLGTYSNCTITVTDASSNPSTPLSVSDFTIIAGGTSPSTPNVVSISLDSGKVSGGKYSYGSKIALSSSNQSVDKIQYKWNGKGDWKDYSGKIRLKEGKNTLAWRALDTNSSVVDSGSKTYNVRKADAIKDYHAVLTTSSILRLVWGVGDYRLDSVKISRSTEPTFSGKNVVELGENDADDRDFTDKTVNKSAFYYYKIAGYDDDGEKLDEEIVGSYLVANKAAATVAAKPATKVLGVSTVNLPKPQDKPQSMVTYVAKEDKATGNIASTVSVIPTATHDVKSYPNPLVFIFGFSLLLSTVVGLISYKVKPRPSTTWILD